MTTQYYCPKCKMFWAKYKNFWVRTKCYYVDDEPEIKLCHKCKN